MPLGPFTAFTALGAGIWTAILTATGYWLGRSSGDMDYTALVHRGKELASSHLPLVIVCAVALVAVYYFASKLVMGGSKKRKDGSNGADVAARVTAALAVAMVAALNAEASNEPSRWRIVDGNRRIEWNVAADAIALEEAEGVPGAAVVAAQVGGASEEVGRFAGGAGAAFGANGLA